LVWAKQFTNAYLDNGDPGASMAIDSRGYTYTAGFFADTSDFDPSNSTFYLIPYRSGIADIFITKLDPFGNLVWAKQFAGAGYKNDVSIAVDSSGNVYTSGWFADTLDVDPGNGIYDLIGSSAVDIFISKLDSSGNFVWGKEIGGPTAQAASSISVDNDDNVYITGSFYGTVDFDPGSGISNLTPVGGEDIFVAKFDSNGNINWAKEFGGTGMMLEYRLPQIISEMFMPLDGLKM
jgi:hypothetical protein